MITHRHCKAQDGDLEAIRQRRMAELMAKQGGMPVRAPMYPKRAEMVTPTSDQFIYC